MAGSPGHISVELLTQYLDALLKGHAFPEPQKKEVNLALLHAIASNDPFYQQKAAAVLGQMGVMERWKLSRLIDEIAAPARPTVKEKFADYMVGMLPEDFAGAQTRQYEQGHRLFASGDDAEEAFLVDEGTVLISKNGRKITTCGRNEFFGNLPFLIPVKRTADAFALTPAKVRVLSRADYLRKFATYSSKRQGDEFLLGYTMIRQLITGLARYESSVKVLVDYLFPGQSRNEQTEALGKWAEHFTHSQCFGSDRIFALFNLLELLDQELLLLAHLDTADKQVLANIQSGKGILRGVGVSNLKTGLQALQVMEKPPVLHRFVNDFSSAKGVAPKTIEVLLLADFLLPEAGTRKAVLSTADAAKLMELMKPEGLIYFAGSEQSHNLRKVTQAGFAVGEMAQGLYVLNASGQLGPVRAIQLAQAEKAGTAFFKKLGGLWRG